MDEVYALLPARPVPTDDRDDPLTRILNETNRSRALHDESRSDKPRGAEDPGEPGELGEPGGLGEPGACEVVDITSRMYARISDQDVRAAMRVIADSGVLPFLTEKMEQAKVVRAALTNKTGETKPGRPVRVRPEHVLIAMWLAASTGQPMLMTTFRDILFHCISPFMRRTLGFRGPDINPRPTDAAALRTWNKSAAKAVNQAFNRMTSVIEPSDEIAGRKALLWDEMKRRGHTNDDMARLQVWLDWTCNQILNTTYMMLPQTVRKFDTGCRCIDATPMRLFARGRGIDDPQASAMPCGSYYCRNGNHYASGEDPDDPDAKPTGGKAFWALDLHLMVMSDVAEPDKQRLPGLVTGMTSDRAAVAPADNARRLLANEKYQGFRTGYITGDGLYANADPDTLQIPIRRLGYKTIWPITKNTAGPQGSHKSGMVLVDGTYMCPFITDQLKNATPDYLAGNITLATYQARIKARNAKFAMTPKQNADDRGVGERLGCKAADHALAVKCPLKPNSMKPRPIKQPEGDILDLRDPIIIPPNALTNGIAPTCCQKQAITLKPVDGAKFRQAIPFGTDQHTDIYNRLRQTQEGMHGFLKDPAHENLDDPSRRRVRSKAGQQLIAAFLIAAANVRKIRQFMAKAIPDANGDLYVPRIPRTGAHARTGFPPGAGGPTHPLPLVV